MIASRQKPSAASLAFDPILVAIEKVVPPGAEPWFGTVADLRDVLDGLIPASAKGSAVFWPRDAHSLSRRLDTLAHGLTARGLILTRRRNSAGRGIILCRAEADAAPEPEPPARPPADSEPARVALIVSAVAALVPASGDRWHGTPTDLLAVLAQHADAAVLASPAWPRLPQPLMVGLRQATDVLRTRGIALRHPRGALRLMDIERTGTVLLA